MMLWNLDVTLRGILMSAHAVLVGKEKLWLQEFNVLGCQGWVRCVLYCGSTMVSILYKMSTRPHGSPTDVGVSPEEWRCWGLGGRE